MLVFALVGAELFAFIEKLIVPRPSAGRVEGGGMKVVELYGQVRRAVYVEGLSRREAARRFGIDPRTVAKMLLAFSVPPSYRRGRPPLRPKLDPYIGIIDRILEEDRRFCWC